MDGGARVITAAARTGASPTATTITHTRARANKPTATRDELLQELGAAAARKKGSVNGDAAPALPRVVLVSQDVAAGEERMVAALSPAIAELGGRVDVSAVLSIDISPKEPHLTLSPFRMYVCPCPPARPQVLVNCAGTSVSGAFDEVVEEAFEDMYRVNVLGSVFPTRAVLPLMKRQRSGAIVFVSSQAGQVGLWGYTAYSASKFALRGLAQALQMEVGTCVCACVHASTCGRLVSSRADARQHHHAPNSFVQVHPFNIFVSVAYPPDTDTPGFQVEELTKPTETSMICGVGNVFPADHVRVWSFVSRGWLAGWLTWMR